MRGPLVRLTLTPCWLPLPLDHDPLVTKWFDITKQRPLWSKPEKRVGGAASDAASEAHLPRPRTQHGLAKYMMLITSDHYVASALKSLPPAAATAAAAAAAAELAVPVPPAAPATRPVTSERPPRRPPSRATTPAARPATSGGQVTGRPVSRAALPGSRPGTSSAARGARGGVAALAEEDAACYLECELLLYGSAGAYAVARSRLLDWRQNDFAVRAIQVASAKRFGWTQHTERRQMTESEGATKVLYALRPPQRVFRL